MDGREWLADYRNVQTALPSLPPDVRYSGEDGTGRVRVELDGAARDVAVGLKDGWRSAVASEGLAAAVLQAFSAATTARLTAWATAPATKSTSAPSGEPGQLPTQLPWPQANQLTLYRAWRDLREFQLRLTSLHNATETAHSPGRLAVITVAGGQIVSLDLDPAWLPTATSQDLERHIGHALRAALAMIAALPERALEGCPDLAALLSGAPFSQFGFHTA